MQRKLNLVLERSNEKPIVYDAHYIENTAKKPIAIFCHGYKGFKDWGAWNLVAETFAKAGFFFLKFNFSHNGGTMSDPIDFPDLEAFAQNNYSKELDDLETIIDHVCSNSLFSSEINTENISLIGHSRGGGVVLIKAQEDNRIKKVVTWAGVSNYKALFFEGSEAFLKWKEDGVTYVENGRTGQLMPHNWQFYLDFVANEERLTIKRAVKGLTKPQLIVHGTNDPTVTISKAEALHAWNPNSILEIISNADHVFGAKHPWNEVVLPTHLLEVVQKTIQFLK